MIRVVGCAALLLAAWCMASAGAEEPGELVVHVTSAGSAAPLADVRVLVVGSSAGHVYAMRTDGAGDARNASLVAGAYRVHVSLNDFEAAHEQVEVRSGKTTVLDVELRPLRLIGSVRAKPSRAVFVDRVSEQSRVRKFSPTLLDALNNLGGVQVTQINGLGALVALHGEDVTNTKYEINGVPLAGAGAGAAVNTDLLQEASIDQANDIVSFQYLNPTVQTRVVAQESDGGFGSGLTRLTAQGSTGALGFAAAVVGRRADSLLNDQTYRDLSGYDYRHSGELFAKGNYLKVSAPLGTWTAAAQGDFSSSITSPIPTYYAGDLPAGYGPGEHVLSRTSNVVVTANGPLGTRGDGGSISISTWRTAYLDDASSRVIATLPLPVISDDRTSGRSITFALAGSTPYLSQRLSLSHSVTDQTGGVTIGSGPQIENRLRTTTSDATFNLEHTGKNSQLVSLMVDATSTLGHGVGVTVRPSLKLKPSPSDDVSFAASYGNRILVPVNATRTLSDSAAATYDCAGQIVSVQGPGDTVADSHSAGVNAGWVHRAPKSQVGIFAYATSVSHALLTDALVPLSLEPAGYAPPGFVSSVLAGYHQLGGCAGPAPSADRFLFVQNIAGLSALYSGATIDATRTLPWGVVDVRYTRTGARITGADRRLTGPLSPYVVGGQLPNVPLSAIGVTLDSRLGSRGTEALLHYAWTSGNNRRNLPGFGEYSFGLVQPFGAYGELAVIATNLSGTYAGAFVSPRDAVDLPTVSGAPFPTLSSPLRPQTVFVQFTFRYDRADAAR